MYTSAIAAVKISILLLYRRLFPDRRFRIILWTFGAFILTYSTVQLLVTLFQCRPIPGAWDPFIRAKCIKMKVIFLITGSLNVATDVTTLCLPMPLLWRLNVSIVHRLQVMSMFLLGGLYVLVMDSWASFIMVSTTNHKFCKVFALLARTVSPDPSQLLYPMQPVGHAHSLNP